ncbi:hypothetical protein IKS57_02980 [bacterium]|nr:hypothetical protein [bacterium]
MNKNQRYKYIKGPIIQLPTKTIEYLSPQKANNKLSLKDSLLKYLY